METQVIEFTTPGGPEVLQQATRRLEPPGAGEVRVRHTSIGLNFVDVYHRTGLYPTPLPAVPGVEAAGVVDECGDGVTGFTPGDRVAYAGGTPGAYASFRNVQASLLVHVPDTVSDDVAAASLLKGMTAEYLLRRTHAVKAGETIVIHAAAGGTGSLLSQWARHLGATVIGVVGSDEKAQTAADNGCHHVVVTAREDFAKRTLDITNGAGVPVVYDSVGETTWRRSLDCLQPRGLLVLFGQSSGPVPPVDPSLLAKGSYYLTRPSLFVYNRTREALEDSARALFDVLGTGAVRVAPPLRRPLAQAAEAHAALEGRRTTGSTVLIP